MSGSVQVPGVLPLVQPGALTLPSALYQPPEYQAQVDVGADSRSPMVGAVCGGSRLASGVPGANGWYVGWIVFTEQSPHTVPAAAWARPGGSAAPSGLAAWVSARP